MAGFSVTSSGLADPFVTPPTTPLNPPESQPTLRAPPTTPLSQLGGPPALPDFAPTTPVVNNYPAAANLTMHHSRGPPPRGTPGRIQLLQNLMHGSQGGAAVMGSDARYHDSNTSAQLDYGLPAMPANQYRPGGAPVSQELAHPQNALGGYLSVQEELADMLPSDMADERMYGFHPDSKAPFINMAGDVFPNTYPVMRIENIPFGVSYAEIMMHMEKHLMPSGVGAIRNYPIHIFMDRPTGKSQDAWLELPDQAIMDQVMSRYESLVTAGKQPKMANRVVDCFVSSQGELMAALFPNAKDIDWHPATGIPIMTKLDDNGDPYSTGFRGFLSKEELYCVRMHAENPGRAPFPQKALQRCYESMIATILKYPWASPYFKISERDEFFNTYLAMLETLATKVHDQDYISVHGRHVGLTDRLCTNFVNIGLRCPGFSERQKARIADTMSKLNTEIGFSGFSYLWPFLTLGVPPEVNDQDIEQWMYLFDGGCTMTERNPSTYATCVNGLVELGRDGQGVWLMQDLSARAVLQEVPGAQEFSFADMAAAETLFMKALIQRGWEDYFRVRGQSMPDTIVPSEDEVPVIKKKMETLGVYIEGGIERPKVPKAGDDIVYVPPEERGAWRHLLRTSTTEIPVRSLTESFSRVGLGIADPNDEIAFQRIQAMIRGEIDVDDDSSSSATGALTAATGEETTDSEVAVRPGYGAMHPQATPHFHARTNSRVSKNKAQDPTPQATPQETPRAGIRSAYASGTFSAPQRTYVSINSPDDGQEINFGQIAQQVVATKSRENTPQSKTASAHKDPFGPGPAQGSAGSPNRAGRASTSTSSAARRRSKSPNKNSYNLSVNTRAWVNAPQFGSVGAIGTPPRRPAPNNTVNTAPTISEGEEEQWPTPSHSSRRAGRSSRD